MIARFAFKENFDRRVALGMVVSWQAPLYSHGRGGRPCRTWWVLWPSLAPALHGAWITT
jgi:hypothetical protein